MCVLLLSSSSIQSLQVLDDAPPINGSIAFLESEPEHLLHWAISHSDPEALRQAASAQREGLLADILEQRQRVQELKDIMEQLPSETELMKDALTVIGDPSISEDEKLRVVSLLAELVEPIDNANNLQALGGLHLLAEILSSGSGASPALQGAACSVISSAAKNNVIFQQQLMQSIGNVFEILVRAVSSLEGPDLTRCVYAISAMTRNAGVTRTALQHAGGVPALMGILQDQKVAPRTKKVIVSLIHDWLVEDPRLGGDICADASLVQAAVGLLGLQGEHLDLQEKVVMLLDEVLLRGPEGTLDILKSGSLEGHLRKLLTHLEGSGKMSDYEQGVHQRVDQLVQRLRPVLLM